MPTPVGNHFRTTGDKTAVLATPNLDARTNTLITPPGIKTLAKAEMQRCG